MNQNIDMMIEMSRFAVVWALFLMVVYCFIFRRIFNRHFGCNKSFEQEEEEKGKNLFSCEKIEWNWTIFVNMKFDIHLYLRTGALNLIGSPLSPIKCTEIYGNLAAQTLNYCSLNFFSNKTNLQIEGKTTTSYWQ